MVTKLNFPPSLHWKGLCLALIYTTLIWVSQVALAELKPSQLRAIDSRMTRLDTVSQTLDAIETARDAERALKTIDKIVKDMQRYPADAPQVVAVLDHAEALRPKVEAALTAANSLAAERAQAQADAAGALTTLLASPQYRADMSRLAALKDTFQAGWSRLDLGHGQYKIRDDEGMNPFLRSLGQKEQLVDEANALIAKYAPYQRMRGARDIPMRIMEVRQHMDRFTQAHADFSDAFPSAQEEAAAALHAALDDLIKHKNGYKFSDDTSALYKLRTRVVVQPIVYAAMQGIHAGEVKKIEAQAIARFEKVKAEGHHHNG